MENLIIKIIDMFLKGSRKMNIIEQGAILTRLIKGFNADLAIIKKSLINNAADIPAGEKSISLVDGEGSLQISKVDNYNPLDTEKVFELLEKHYYKKDAVKLFLSISSVSLKDAKKLLPENEVESIRSLAGHKITLKFK